MKLCLTVLFVLICTSITLATTDRELKECRHQCKVQRQLSEKDKQACERRCEDYYREKKQRESGRGEGEQGRGGKSATEPEKRLRECQKECGRQEGQERSLCRFRCQQRYQTDKGRGEEEPWRIQEEGQEDINEEKLENPYVFQREHFVTAIRSDYGKVDVLPRFTKRSELLQGVENYRLSIIETDPQTFISPSHVDAETILYVANGRGTVTVIDKDKRRSFNVECGDVIRLRAGINSYIINRDDSEKLYLISFLQPVNLPGKHRSFVAPNVDARGSFYKAFSTEWLQAAFQTDRGRIDRIFAQRNPGIVKASKEQIQAMTNDAWVGSKFWSFKSESGGPFNLLHKHPVLCNNYGQLIEATPDKHKEQLRDLDLMISFLNITQGAMMGPHYNSRAIKLAVVVDGEGQFEMSSPPDFSTTSQGQPSSPSYARVSSRLEPGMVFIVPAGYPLSIVAYPNSNLKIVCFEVNGHGNIRFPLAGKNNVVKQWEREAKELAFGLEEREVDEVLGSQNEEWFFPGPKVGRWSWVSSS